MPAGIVVPDTIVYVSRNVELVVISAIELYLFLVCLRLALWKAGGSQATRVSHGLQVITDPLPDAVGRALRSRGTELASTNERSVPLRREKGRRSYRSKLHAPSARDIFHLEISIKSRRTLPEATTVNIRTRFIAFVK